MSIKQRRQISAALSVATATTVLMAGCTSTGPSILGEKVDYRTAGAKTVSLDVPPDLSKLPGQSRYGQITPAVVSANNVNRPTAEAVQSGPIVAPGQFGPVKLERQGQTRWLSVTAPPEQVWETVRAFWVDSGFELTVDQPEAGLMETNWAENRAKLPQDLIRRTVGNLVDGLYDTGERDQYKTRIERTSKGCEIYVTHRGVSEEYTSAQKDQTRWQRRAEDPALEAEILGRLMVKLGASKETVEQAKTSVVQTAASAAASSNQVRLLEGNAALSVDDDFDTVWRRVGLALDRASYTIENRERAKGIYEVRLPGDSLDKPKKPGFWSGLFGSDKAGTEETKYRVSVQGSGNQTSIKVTDQNGQVLNTPTAQRIAKDLQNELI